MIVSFNRINSILLYCIIFLTFFGFYGILLLAINSGMTGFTRIITIPVRVFVATGLVLLVFFNIKKLIISRELFIYLLFSFFFIMRMIVDYYSSEHYYLYTSELLLYFFSFSVIPFLSINMFSFDRSYIRVVFNAMFHSGLIFTLLAFVFYNQYIGQVHRLATSTAGEDVVSPLILSYCATLLFGIILTYLIFNESNFFFKVLCVVALPLLTVPFFLGASRGSIFAFFFPFLILGLARNNIRFLFNSVLVVGLMVLGLVMLDGYFESGLLDRFTGTLEEVESGGSSASRIEIWNVSFGQFLNNPFFGDKFRVEGFDSYSHNLFLEVLQTTGIVGFLPFVYLLISTFRASIIIFRNNIEFAWVSVVFIQAFTQSMFSGSLYTASWLWTSMAVILSVSRMLTKHPLFPVSDA